MARLFVVLLVALALVGCDLGDEAEAPPPETVTVVPVEGGPDPVLDPGQQQTQLERPEGIDSHEDAKDSRPPGISEEELERAESTPPGVGDPQPLGGAQTLACPRNIVRNHSARAPGSVVSMFVVHYTVSAPGTLAVIRGLFNTPSFGASSTFGLEPDGECETWVDPDRKPWTQLTFNSVSESVEIIARGTETRAWWLRQPIIKNGLLASLIADRLRARGLPPRFVDPVGCTPQAGWTDHDRLECGNNHTDVQPNFPYDVVAKQVRQRFLGENVAVWSLRSHGKVLRQLRVDRNGYNRVLAWMEGPGRSEVSKAERRNGEVILRKLTVRLG